MKFLRLGFYEKNILKKPVFEVFVTFIQIPKKCISFLSHVGKYTKLLLCWLEDFHSIQIEQTYDDRMCPMLVVCVALYSATDQRIVDAV